MNDERWATFWLMVAVVCMAALWFAIAWVKPALARDNGQWGDSAVSEWYRTLMQPDNPTISCCGEADAYWCDGLHVKDGKTFCTITDDRPDEPRQRAHIDVGTQIEIPDAKLKWDRGNPTGHAIVFLASGGWVYCFVQNGGV